MILLLMFACLLATYCMFIEKKQFSREMKILIAFLAISLLVYSLDSNLF